MKKDDWIRRIAEMDQSAKVIHDTLPSFFYGLYKGFVAEGFTEEHAFRLTRDYLISMNQGPVERDEE